jgi:hypothetical protein
MAKQRIEKMLIILDEDEIRQGAQVAGNPAHPADQPARREFGYNATASLSRMNDIVREWVEKAEGDFHSAEGELRTRIYPNYDVASFHSQQ